MSATLAILCTLAIAADTAAVDFDTQIMPVFTKAGCNTGACHGAAIGRGGFKLSLYGGDPAADYEAIVHQLEGRRINLARPRSSLLLTKPSERLEHGGGRRLEWDGPRAKLLESWIAAGAPRLKARRLTRLGVTPQREIIDRLGRKTHLRATAHFDDGSRADVTPWTVFTPADADAVNIDDDTAEAIVRRRGQNIVIARYLDRVVPLELIVSLGERAVDLSGKPRRNFIDDHVLKTLETLRLPPSPPADDAAFLRRLRLDLTGRLPTPEEVREFSAQRSMTKRVDLVDRWLKSSEFVDFWTYKFAKLLRIRDLGREPQVAETLHGWLREQVAADAPLDQIARTLLTATGDSHQHGPAGFYRLAGGPREQAEYVSELFLGVRLRCANCHNHPLDRWTQDDYHGLAAIFARLETGRHVRLGLRGDVTHPGTGEAAVARIPGIALPPSAAGSADHRIALADWLTAKDNPYFARAMVNRLWKSLMGRGLIEPTDDLRETNPASHPELLQKLADDFAQHGFRIRHTLRWIATSAAYGRSSAVLPENRMDDRFYSHALERALEPEVLLDAIVDVTGVPEIFPDQRLETRAIALIHPGVPSPALDILGRCDRRDTCESGGAPAGGLSAKLHLLNGPLVNEKITSRRGRLHALIEAAKSNEEIVAEFYVRALGRSPQPEETSHWSRAFKGAGGTTPRMQALEDFVWSLLNCREFRTNH
jgi:hypothetical protein